MSYAWVVAVALVACSGKKDKAVDKPPPTGDTARQPDPQCAEMIPPFAEWMKGLVADGHVTVVATGVDLVSLDVGPTPITRGAPVVTIRPSEVVVDGTLVADPSKTKGADLAKQVVAMIETKPGPDIVVVIDGRVAWSSVAPLLRGVASAKHSRVTLVFAAGQAGAASPPPQSSIDAQLDALAHPDPAKPAAALAGAGRDDSLDATLFADCPEVTQNLMPAIAKLSPGEFDVAVTLGMPRELESCSCRVELAAVQRLMWSWWGRDRGPALASVKVEIAAVAKDGTAVTAKPDAPWAEASELVLAAAEQGKPISPR